MNTKNTKNYSQLSYLFGILGKPNFILYWDVIKNGASTPGQGHLENIKRGKIQQLKILNFFQKQKLKNFLKTLLIINMIAAPVD